jgi:hypothetical protein
MAMIRFQVHARISFLALALAGLSSCTLTKQTNTLSALQMGETTPPPQTVSLNMTGYLAPSGHTFKNLFVSNFSVKASKGTLSPVSARDGLPDALKENHLADYGFTIVGPNSANPYFSDLMLWLSGILYTQQNLLYCSPSMTQSTSNDALVYTDNRTSPPSTQFLGLRDCEKAYIGLNPALFDFDGDGIPDYLELRCGLNPANPNDAPLNMAADGVSNLEKCKRNIPIDESANLPANQLFAYQYSQAVQADGTTTFSISNIPILNGGQNNFIAFYLVEVNATTLQPYLYTAFTILPPASQNKTYTFAYWATAPANDFNQEITFQ